MKRTPNLAATLDEALKQAPQVCRAQFVGVTSLAMREGGASVSSSKRDELLAKCKAGEHVELEVDVKAFEQERGVDNRNFIEFREGALVALGRSGKGTPVLRDHEQNDVMARAGTVIASKTEKLADGHYVIQQTWFLTAPWAVELALRGLLSTVSIGWHPTGPVNCSACGTEVFSKCYHFPGDRVSEVVAEDGTKRYRRDSAGSTTIRWVFTAAELIECSAVSVPAVPSAHIEGIRAALSALVPVSRADTAPVGDGIAVKEISMNLLATLVGILGLAATAGEDEVATAVKSMKSSRDQLKTERDDVAGKLVEATAKLDTQAQAAAKKAEDDFIASMIASGKLIPGTKAETSFRAWYAADSKGATEHAESMPVITPVGQPRQSGTEPKADKKSDDETSVRSSLAAANVDADKAIAWAKKFGCANPEQSIAKAIGVEI